MKIIFCEIANNVLRVSLTWHPRVDYQSLIYVVPVGSSVNRVYPMSTIFIGHHTTAGPAVVASTPFISKDSYISTK